MRSATSEATVSLKASKNLSLDQCIEFIAEDELIEVTPNFVRLRKMDLDANSRISKKRKEKKQLTYF